MAYAYDRGYGAPRYGGGMGGYGGRFAGGYGPEFDPGFAGGYGYPAGPGFGYGGGYGGGFGYGSLAMPSPYAPPRSNNYVTKFRPTSSFDYYGTASVPIYISRVPPRGRAFPRHMPMIAHQRMSAIAPAPLYSAASARVAAYEDEMFEPVAPSRPSYKYSNSFMEDTVNATMQDIEDDMRNLRTTATSVLNKYTPTALSHLDPAAKKAERKSRFAFGYNQKSDKDKETAADEYQPSYYKLSSASTKESPVLMPIYVARHSIYSKSLTKDPEIERKEKGEKSYRDSTIGNSAQSRRPASSYETYKISDSITFLSHYIRQAKRPTSTGPAFSTRESRLARRASARDRAADRKDPDRVKGRVAEKIAAQEAEKAKEREELERWKASAKAEVKWKHSDEAEDSAFDWLNDLGPSSDAPADASAEPAEDAPAEAQPEPELDAEPAEEVKEVKKKKKKKVVKEPTPEPEPAEEVALDEAAPAEEPAAEETPAPEAPAEEAAAPLEEETVGEEEKKVSPEEEAVTVGDDSQQQDTQVQQEPDVQQETAEVEAEAEPVVEDAAQSEQTEAASTEPEQFDTNEQVEQVEQAEQEQEKIEEPVEEPVAQPVEQENVPEVGEQAGESQEAEQAQEPAVAEQPAEVVEESAVEEQQQTEEQLPVTTSEELKELSWSENEEAAVQRDLSAAEVDPTDEAVAEPNVLEESQTVAPHGEESEEESEEEE